MRPIVLSALDRLAKCSGSHSLPQWRDVAPESDAGKAMHAVREAVVKIGRSNVLGDGPLLDSIADEFNLEDKARALFFWHARTFNPFPDGPGIEDGRPVGALAEVALALWQDGTVTRVPWERSADIPAEDVARLVVWGKIDMMWSAPTPLDKWQADEAGDIVGSTLYVTDWKSTASDNTPPATRNRQLRTGAMLAARWTGATHVNASLCFTECPKDGQGGHVTGGRWEPVDLDAAALDAIEAEVREIHAKVNEATEALVWTGIVNAHLTAGPHCGYCPARPTCPRFAGEVAALATMPAATMSTDAIVRVWEMRAAVERTVRAIGGPDGTIAAMVRARKAAGEPPIVLSDGRALDVVIEAGEELDPCAVHVALGAELDDGAKAWDAIRASKDGIRDTLRAAGISPLGKAVDRVLAAVRAAGGVTERPREVLRAVNVKGGDDGKA